MKPMRQQFIRLLGVYGVAAGLAACATPATTVAPTATVAAAQAQPTPQPTLDVGTLIATPETGSAALQAPVSGTGEIKTLNDADLNFLVTGTVQQILVKEGDSVKKDALLATLDTTIYDQQVRQAEANLASAKAQLAGYDVGGPDSLAAKAQLAQAQAAVDATKSNSTSADVEAAKLSLTAAKYTLQSTKDRLSLSKTQAQIQLDLANQSLAQAEAQYALDKFNWDWVSENGTDPYTPTAMGRPNRINEATIRRYQSLHDISLSRRDSAKSSLQSAQIAYDQAKQAEQVGIDSAAQQVAQAELALRRLTNPTGKDKAALDASFAQAQAAVNRITVLRAQAEAGVAQAEAALASAQLNRQRAELRAPFDGVVSLITVSVGDPANPASRVAIQLIDTKNLRAEVLISDIDIARVQLNQKATINVDAVAGTNYSGTVTFIAPIATVVGNARLYTVHVTLDQITDLRAGMSARISLGN
ncbi:MAG: HlyD family secretion protein [Roseiflexaceae bacterium]|jgi:HlyD family secretion protein|nr:HlyD family efflux transporter periplasmic adaptor subunit [Chloroflexaceae bacterium]